MEMKISLRGNFEFRQAAH